MNNADLEKKVFAELETLKEQNILLKQAVVMLIKKSPLTAEQALSVINFIPTFNAEKLYHKGDYFTYGKDEKGNPQLWKVSCGEIRGHIPNAKDWNGDNYTIIFRKYDN